MAAPSGQLRITSVIFFCFHCVGFVVPHREAVSRGNKHPGSAETQVK